MKNREIEKLIERAVEAMKNAYAPYSNFRVGAVVVAKDGRIFTGVNIENASYGLTVCAERTAIFKAVSEGVRDFDTLVVVADTVSPVSPCGACRQVMAEFGNFRVILANTKGEYVETSVLELLPLGFSGDELKQGKG